MRPKPEPPGPGQTSVWTFPRPAIAEACAVRVTIEHRGQCIADTEASVRTIETSHPPSYYIPLRDIAPGVLRRATGGSFCEWKGQAIYWDVVLGDGVPGDGVFGDVVILGVGWSYPEPSRAFASIRDHVAFYAAPFDRCTVEGAIVVPQPGGFYGGWITPDLAGPFKGGPGSMGW